MHLGGVVGVARHVEDAQVRALLHQARREIGSAHAGHDDVGDEHVGTYGRLRGPVNRLFRVARFEHRVAAASQRLSDRSRGSRRCPRRAAGFRSLRWRWRRVRPPLGRWRRVGDRQIDPERCAAARRRVQRDAAAALIDDAVDRGQAKAGALPLCFRGEERLEGVGARRFVHSDARVGDRQHHVGTRFEPESFSGETILVNTMLAVSIVSGRRWASHHAR